MAGLPTHDFTVGGVRYSTTVLGAIKGRALYLRLLKAVGPALPKLAGLSENPEESLLGALSGILQGLDCDLLDALCTEFAAVTVMPSDDGTKRVPLGPVFDIHFAGKYQHMVGWLVECVKLNGFVDFLAEIFGRVKAG